MFGMRGRPVPPAVDGYTLASRHAQGLDGGSGDVAPGRAFTFPDAGLEQRLGHRPVATAPQLDTHRLPDSIYATRAMTGGARSSAAFAEYTDPAPLTGAYRMLGHRARVTIDPLSMMAPQQDAPQVAMRQVPPAVSGRCYVGRAGAEPPRVTP